MLPVLPLIKGPWTGPPRAFYPAALVLAILVGVGAATAARGAAWRAVAWAAPIALLFLDFLAFRARTELRVASTIRAARAELERFASDPRSQILLIEPPAFLAGWIPLLGADFANAAHPPFGRSRAPRLTLWPLASTLRRWPGLVTERAPVRILEWDGSGLVARGPALGPIPETLPVLARDPSEDGLFRVTGPVPPRVLSGIRISAGRPAGVAVSWGAGTEIRRVAFERATGAPLVVGFPDEAFDERWFTQGALEWIRVEGGDPGVVPVLLTALPGVTIAEALASVRGSPMRVSFRSSAAAASFRIAVELTIVPDGPSVPLIWKALASDLSRTPAGDFVFVAAAPAEAALGGRTQRLSWNDVVARVLEIGTPPIVDVRVEAIDASGINVIARSDWASVRIDAN
jgi:hypothetical protein